MPHLVNEVAKLAGWGLAKDKLQAAAQENQVQCSPCPCKPKPSKRAQRLPGVGVTTKNAPLIERQRTHGEQCHNERSQDVSRPQKRPPQAKRLALPHEVGVPRKPETAPVAKNTI